MQVVREPPGARALHQRTAKAVQASAEQSRKLAHGRLVFRVTP